MEIKRGMNRFVLLMPNLGMVLKFPRILWRDFFSACWYYLKTGNIEEMFGELEFPVEVSEIKFTLCKGFHDNWKEFEFSLRERNGNLETTYFSLFGILNLQQASGSSTDFDVWSVLRKTGTDEEKDALQKDIHHFSNPENFSLTKEGKIKLRDYGSKKTQKVLKTLNKDFFARAEKSIKKQYP